VQTVGPSPLKELFVLEGVELKSEFRDLLSYRARYLCKHGYSLYIDPDNLEESVAHLPRLLDTYGDFCRKLAWKLVPRDEHEEKYNSKLRTEPTGKWPLELPCWFKVGCNNGWSMLKEETHKALVESHTTNKPGLRLADFVDLACYLADKTLLVLAMDKNLGLSVVMKEWYLSKITTLFDNPKTYKVLTRGQEGLVNRVKTFDKTLALLCTKFGSTLTDQEVNFMREPLAFLRYENMEGISDTDLSLCAIGVIPRAYGIPKVHKKPWQLRPIVPFTK
jgi:hypothetical protein